MPEPAHAAGLFLGTFLISSDLNHAPISRVLPLQEKRLLFRETAGPFSSRENLPATLCCELRRYTDLFRPNGIVFQSVSPLAVNQ